MAKLTIIGLGGTNGSGKDIVGEMLAERHGFLFVSNSDILREEARRRGLSTERENLRSISAEWRRQFGLSVLVDKAVEIFKNAGRQYRGLVTASYRNPAEADRTHELGGIVVWTDAEPRIRYDRIYTRQRTAEDNKTFEQFLAEEEAEMHHSGDEATLNSAGVKARADIFLFNNGNDIEAFKNYAEKELMGVIKENSQ